MDLEQEILELLEIIFEGRFVSFYGGDTNTYMLEIKEGFTKYDLAKLVLIGCDCELFMVEEGNVKLYMEIDKDKVEFYINGLKEKSEND